MGCLNNIPKAPVKIHTETTQFIKEKDQPLINLNHLTNELKQQNHKNIQKLKLKQQKILTQKTKKKNKITMNQDNKFLFNYLNYENKICNSASANKIRRRQILTHHYFINSKLLVSKPSNPILIQQEIKSWMQRILLEIFEQGYNELFERSKSINDVKKRIAQKYIFELCQFKQFIDSGYSIVSQSQDIKQSQIKLSLLALSSDSALFPVLRLLKQKYPQESNSGIKLLQIKEIKKDINLLNNFQSKCYSEPEFRNIQTIYQDLKFLIDKSIQQQIQFQVDMKAILGEDVLTDAKVKRKEKNGVFYYNASTVRRILIRLVETMIQTIPDIKVTPDFLEFIKSKNLIVDKFYNKSRMQTTTHSKVNEILLNLLQSLKYDMKTLQQNNKFGFYIYDLLRCKISRDTSEQVTKLLKKMLSTTKTFLGKKFEVIKINNRFKTHQDLIVNFRYGQVLVGEAQLCINTSSLTEKAKKINKLNEFIQELERGLFGPTFELMMQYEDFTRVEILTNLQTQGEIFLRKLTKPTQIVKKSNRKCLSNHSMLKILGSYQYENGYFCDYCFRSLNINQPYHYCYECALMYCLNCQGQYQKEDLFNLQLLCTKEEVTPHIKSEEQLKSYCQEKKSIICCFYLSNQSASIIAKDFLVYFKCAQRMDKTIETPIYLICCDVDDQLAGKFKISRYPSIMVLNSEAQAQVTLVGCCLSQWQSLKEIQNKLARGESKTLPVLCGICQDRQMQMIQIDEELQFQCNYCHDISKKDLFQNYFKVQDKKRVFTCRNGHYRCIFCAYTGTNQPSVYQDYYGYSYLSKNKIKQKNIECQRGHTMQHTLTNISNQIQYNCFKCQSDFLFNDEEGMAFCKECNVQACSLCLSISKQPMADNQLKELISQNIQVSAEDAYPCQCGRLFKKVLNTRLTKEDGFDEPNLITQVKWKCILCQQTFADGNLHYACFFCPFLFFHNSTKQNIEICMGCAIKIELQNIKLSQRVSEKESTFICQSNHPMVRTRLNYSKKLSVNCMFCGKMFYTSTERLHCNTCNTDCCFKCSLNLTNTKDNVQQQSQNKKGRLFNKQKIYSLKSCDGCKSVIYSFLHQNSKVDNYNLQLCLNCTID